MHGVATMCRVLGVSTSGYYAWRTRPRSERARADAELSLRIGVIHQGSRATYGAPRIHAELADQGIHVGCKRIARLMAVAGIYGVSRRKWITTTTRDHDARPAPDLVERDFSAPTPNAVWVADITYIPTWAGFLYLAVVLDVFSRRVVGWAMETHLRTELVLAALNMANRTAAACRGDSSLRPRHSIHFDRVRNALPAGRGATLDGFGRRLFRQRDGGEFFRDLGMRAARAPQFQNSD
jgi:putative transposase